jgi:hypothetical protein
MHRGWHVEGLAVRPDHRMVGHTGFLIYSAAPWHPGSPRPAKRTRPAKGAYGPDYDGPRAMLRLHEDRGVEILHKTYRVEDQGRPSVSEVRPDDRRRAL